MTRGDSKSDEKARFPRIGASLPPIFGVAGVLLFSGELKLSALLRDPSEATLAVTGLAIALGSASLMAIIARARRTGLQVPWVLSLIISSAPAAACSLLPGAAPGLAAVGLWASAWLVASLGWVAAVEAFSNRATRQTPVPVVVCAACVLVAVGVCAAVAPLLLPLALLGVALPVAHLSKPDAAAESSLTVIAPLTATALWLAYCAMVTGGEAVLAAMPWMAVASVCIGASTVMAIWRVRPRALWGPLLVVLYLGGWALIAGIGATPAPSADPQPPIRLDDGSTGLEVPHRPRNSGQM